ncbi:hypothetical protein PLESTB_000448600 [Pleodorina starrii]|uniref:Uncharacterized protein n=1 Tax=Pleodorina starrii TaxID=330485 RepID=A0A9W6EZS8_9CHLO|nr:hypothetical protein PLESTB_000448600 [Pleodorina starrii]
MSLTRANAYFTARVQHASGRFQHPPYLAWAASLLWYLQVRSYIGVRPPPGAAVAVSAGAKHGAADGSPGVYLNRWDIYSNGHGGLQGVQGVSPEVQEDEGDSDEGTGRVDGMGVDNLQGTVKAILTNIRSTPSYVLGQHCI